MKWINYHHLLYFHTIAQEGGIAKAARKIRVGQPALSTQLKQLEQALGYPLFERIKKTLFLTEKGKIIFEYTSEIFRLGQEMLEAADDQLPEKQIHVQIGALDSLPKTLIHQLVEAAYRAGPCVVSVLEGDGDRLLRELFAHRVDLVLTNSPASMEVNSDCYSKLVAEMDVAICGAPKFSVLRKNFPKSLQQQPFVLCTRHSQLRRDVDHFFEAHGIRIRVIGETQDIEMQKLIALSGHGLIPIAMPAVKEQLKNGTLVQIGKLEHVSEQLWLTYTSRRVKNPIAAKLIERFRVE
jgi:LysR family transcriptional regulator, transcriptional activator of nhaA